MGVKVKNTGGTKTVLITGKEREATLGHADYENEGELRVSDTSRKQPPTFHSASSPGELVFKPGFQAAALLGDGRSSGT